MAANPQVKYDADSFVELKGLEPVRQRPGMYTRTDSPLHIIQEVIDNAADEALGGYAKSILVRLEDDESITIADNGRGIPVGINSSSKIPAVTMAFTRLHAGGKFNKKEQGGAYAFSGGLHGVGVSVTTALSHRILVDIKREGKTFQIEFADNGRKIGEVITTGVCAASDTGTTVRVWPDAKYFDSGKLPLAELERTLISKAVLLPGVRVTFEQGGKSQTWEYPGGLAQYLDELGGNSEPLVPVYVGESYVKDADVKEGAAMQGYNVGEGGSFAFGWYPDGGVGSESYANLIPTPHGGTHVSGLKAGIYDAVRDYIDHRGMMPRGIKLQQDDVVGRLGFVVSAKILDPQFQGQVKEKLNSREAHKLMTVMVKSGFEQWLNRNTDHAKLIVELTINQAMSRMKSAQKVERRRTSGVTLLPDKLTDCDPDTDNEIFRVCGFECVLGSISCTRHLGVKPDFIVASNVLTEYNETGFTCRRNHETI